MKVRVLIICFLVFNNSLFSQLILRKKDRQELLFGVGFSNFLGDLGGANNVGTHNSLVDLEAKLTAPCMMTGYRYRVHKNVSLKTAFSVGIVKGDDKLTNEPYRNNRNLNFRSVIIEVSLQTEFVLTNFSSNKTYKIRNAKSSINKTQYIYGFVGVAGFYFNPQGKLNGKWYNLQPLGTEGQGIKPGTRRYSRVAIAIPIGVGARWEMNERFTAGLEIGYRKTFTDYIDDVSTVYYDNKEIENASGEIAALLADPNKNNFDGQLDQNGNTRSGLQRGNPKENDAYFFTALVIGVKINKSKKTRTKF